MWLTDLGYLVKETGKRTNEDRPFKLCTLGCLWETWGEKVHLSLLKKGFYFFFLFSFWIFLLFLLTRTIDFWVGGFLYFFWTLIICLILLQINKIPSLRNKPFVIISLDFYHTVMERRTLNKLLSIINNPDHPLHPILDRHPNRFFQEGEAMTATENDFCLILFIKPVHSCNNQISQVGINKTCFSLSYLERSLIFN